MAGMPSAAALAAGRLRATTASGVRDYRRRGFLPAAPLMKGVVVSEAARSGMSESTKAKLLLLALGLTWGLSWPATKIALSEIPPWTLRLAGIGLGALTLSVVILVSGRSFRVPRGPVWAHIAISSFFIVAAFHVLSAFAQLGSTTSRVVIVNYSMPIWSSMLAWPILGERPTLMRTLALALCAAGLAVLIYPLTQAALPVGVLFALGCALSWAAGTVYQKWAQIQGDPVVITAWQLIFSTVLIGIGLLAFEGVPTLGPLHWPPLLALAYNGLIGGGVAFLLWFHVVARMPAAAASLGTLSVPVIGILASAWLLHERPTQTDMIGFALIFAAACCVLLQPVERDAKYAAKPAGSA
jgi:drug/metabolite transporter (DMT)-like permease